MLLGQFVLRQQENATVLMTEVNGIDPVARTVSTEAGPFSFDFLVIATGAKNSYFGHHQGAASRSFLNTPQARSRYCRASPSHGDVLRPCRFDRALGPHGPRRPARVIAAYQKAVAETVQRFGGFVAKYVGDGALV
jgi:hypothetical protein